ncbi:LysR substrate-binding domain-containing protein [Nitratireductor sp. StC3]|uniref:LysR substrate-binding domain-containing protein n=1 Tax=Nitratireductor sp. StC3 TaxID=2126741 RepID=UPI000D0CFAF2|nr:LysR substrate-binding domain-containing protein [Nitratireductor sp. StC3]PSM17676.1 LysR family transcriptional regulator [Nitratireductor sp. StC3]
MVAPLPPMAALRAFEAVARHNSFTRAAGELGMTQAAVSYQIKVLEERVGVPLFVRRPRRIELTETGSRLAPAIGEAFERIAAAWQEARHGAQGTLVINTLQTFASAWLARHIGSFQIAHPGIAVRIETDQKVIDFARDEADIAVRSGSGGWPGLIEHELIGTDFSPMLSPGLAASAGGLREPADLLKLPIVSPNDPWWPDWLARAGLAPDALAGRPHTSLGSQAVEASAAIAGQGVALLTTAFYRQEIEAGLLVQPFDIVGTEGQAYFLVYPQARRNAPKTRAFRDWILPLFDRQPR